MVLLWGLKKTDDLFLRRKDLVAEKKKNPQRDSSAKSCEAMVDAMEMKRVKRVGW